METYMSWVENISVYSILPVLLVSLLLLRNKENKYRPFIALIILGSFIEILTTIFRARHISNIPIINLFLLAEFSLILLQLRNWGFFEKRSPFFGIALSAVGLAWIVETWLRADPDQFNNYSQVLASFIIIICVILFLSQLLLEKVNNLLKDTRFLLSIGFLLYFTISILVFIFSNESLQLSSQFYLSLWVVHSFANISANLIYAFGLLCIARK
jgi:hypothetical protein